MEAKAKVKGDPLGGGMPEPMTTQILGEETIKQIRAANIAFPDDESIAKWKKVYNRIFVMIFADRRVCVVRPIQRSELKIITEKMRTMGQDVASPPEDMQAHEEELSHMCLLYPEMTLEQMRTTADAGLAPTIYSTVLVISGFQLAEDPIEL